MLIFITKIVAFLMHVLFCTSCLFVIYFESREGLNLTDAVEVLDIIKR